MGHTDVLIQAIHNSTVSPASVAGGAGVGVAGAGGGTLYVQPGTVGYLGSQSAPTLTHFAPPGSGLPGDGVAPANSSWQSYGLRNDDTNVSWDHYFIHGGIYWTGSGNFTMTNSVVQAGAGTGNAWYAFYSQNASNVGTLTFTDCTMSHTSPDPDVDVAPIWANNGSPMIITRCDSSGMPQGLPAPGGSQIINNYIHDLAQPRPANPLHMDGIFSQGGDNITIQGNYVSVPIRSPSDVTAALFIQVIPSGTGNTGIVVTGNYLKGGSYTLRNETGVGLVCTNNTFDGFSVGSDAWNQSPGTIGTWAGNTHVDGSTVSSP